MNLKNFFFTFPFFHLVDESMFSCALIFPFRWVSLFLLFNAGHISLHQFWAGCHATQRHGWFPYVYGFEKQAINRDKQLCGCHASHPYFHFLGICFLTTLTYNRHCFEDIYIFGLWRNGHSGDRTQPYRDLFNKQDKQLQTETFDLLWHLLCDSCLSTF